VLQRLYVNYQPSACKIGRIEGMRVAYSLEQCWHRVPGGTATAAIEVARVLPGLRRDIELVGFAGRHGAEPQSAYQPPINVQQLALSGPALYEASMQFGWPKVESATGRVNLLHCTSIIPFATNAKMVATIHDLAFLKYPQFFSRRGNSVFRRSLKILLKRADMLLCSSQSTLEDCSEFGFSRDRLRHVPLGVNAPIVMTTRDQIKTRYNLPENYLLFVGTLEPRKNLTRLIAALESLGDSAPELVVVGATGWGDVSESSKVSRQVKSRVRFAGFVQPVDLGAIYASAEVLCYPSLMEGFGLPILEAMSYGTPVVTSKGSSTQEVAGNAAVLVDPLDVASIAAGILQALSHKSELQRLGIERANEMTWQATAAKTADVYEQVVR
jgi:glycosyltransferase involved in cell wall biosynthesis